MNKNITISDLNVEIQGKGNSIRKHLLVKASIFIIEFLLASVLHSYGIFLSEYILTEHHDYGHGIFSSILFICSWSFTDPIARFISDYFEDRKRIFFRYVIGISVVFLFIAVMIPNNVVLYMIFNGIVSNLISTQIAFFATDKMDMDAKIYEVIRQVARALSLFVMPQLNFYLATNPNYDINNARLIFAAILLNIIPAGLLIKTEENVKNYLRANGEISRYQTIGRFSQQMNEMQTFSKQEKSECKYDFESSSSSEEDDQAGTTDEISVFEAPTYQQVPSPIRVDNFTSGITNYGSSEHSVEDLPAPNVHLTLVNVQSYFLNVGVNILPGIPEEDETRETDDINCIDPKRLSIISNKLEEINFQDQIRRDSVKEVFNINEVIKENKPDPINKIEYIHNFKDEKNRISVIDEFKNFQKARHCFHCSPYRKYIWTRRLRMFKDFLNDNFLRPLYHSIKNLYFYPSLMTKVVTNLVSTLYITLAPFLAMKQSWKQNVLFSTENVVFLLTYVAFAWGFFLVGLPLILKLNHSRIRMVFGFGLLVSGTSLLILAARLTNDNITISSLLFGFGYGVITYTEKIVFKTSIGMRPWYLVRGCLEVLSALCILFIYYLLYLHRLELNLLLLLAAFSYYCNAVLWFCLPFLKYFTSIFKRVIFDERSQQEGFFH